MHTRDIPAATTHSPTHSRAHTHTQVGNELEVEASPLEMAADLPPMTAGLGLPGAEDDMLWDGDLLVCSVLILLALVRISLYLSASPSLCLSLSLVRSYS